MNRLATAALGLGLTVGLWGCTNGPPTPTPVPTAPSARVTPEPASDAVALTTGKLAFVSDRDGNANIYVADTSGQRRLTDSPAADLSPAWSPDGSRIAFMSDRRGSQQVYVMNSDGTGVARISRNLPRADSYDVPSWSPDGSRIALVAFQDDNEGDIYTLSVEDGNITYLSPGSSPVWAPDGSRIAFDAWLEEDRDVYVINADGSGLTNITSPGDGMGPAWSPDGSLVAFESLRDYQVTDVDLYLVRPDGSGLTALSRTPNKDISPVWSRDGSRIAFVSQRDDNSEIDVVDLAGLLVARLTPNLGRLIIYPSWSPTGASIAFEAFPDHNPGVYVINADGSGLTVVDRSATTPVWSPLP